MKLIKPYGLCFALTLLFFGIARSLSQADFTDYANDTVNGISLIETRTYVSFPPQISLQSDSQVYTATLLRYPNTLYSLLCGAGARIGKTLTGHYFLGTGLILSFLSLFIGVCALHAICRRFLSSFSPLDNDRNDAFFHSRLSYGCDTIAFRRRSFLCVLRMF